MAIDFPSSPTNGQTYTVSGTTYTYNSTKTQWQVSATTYTFPSGTAMLFAQTSAPTGWTKSTTHDNKALRVVSGTAGSGGTTAFTSVFASRTPAGTVSGTVSGTNSNGLVGPTTLTAAQSGSPAHSHTITDPGHTHTQTTSSTDGANVRADASSGGTLYNNQSNINSNVTGITVNNSIATNAAASHDHGFTNPSWSGSMSASFSGTAMDFAVQYVDTIIATKD